MGKIKYTGWADEFILSKGDLDADKRISFSKNEEIEVDDKLADAILGHDSLKHDFKRVEEAKADSEEEADDSTQTDEGDSSENLEQPEGDLAGDSGEVAPTKVRSKGSRTSKG